MKIETDATKIAHLEDRVADLEAKIDMILAPPDDPWIFDMEIDGRTRGEGVTMKLYHHRNNRWHKKAQPYRDGKPCGPAEIALPL